MPEHGVNLIFGVSRDTQNDYAGVLRWRVTDDVTEVFVVRQKHAVARDRERQHLGIGRVSTGDLLEADYIESVRSEQPDSCSEDAMVG
jgi:hypothetical protein